MITKVTEEIVAVTVKTAVEETKETKKITTLRAPIDYLQPFLHNVPNVASFTYTTKVPTAFSDSGITPTSILCKWNNNIVGETGYRIAKLDSAGNFLGQAFDRIVF